MSAGNRRYMLVLKYYDECILAAIQYYSTQVYSFIVSEHSYRTQRIRVNNRRLKIKNTLLFSMIISVSPVLVFVRFAIRFKAYLVKINKQKKTNTSTPATETFYFFGAI